jgi:hypothetical protein
MTVLIGCFRFYIQIEGMAGYVQGIFLRRKPGRFSSSRLTAILHPKEPYSRIRPSGPVYQPGTEMTEYEKKDHEFQ